MTHQTTVSAALTTENNMTQELKAYYVIWRGEEDDFFITRLDLPVGMIDTLDNNQVANMAHDTEYPDGDCEFSGDYEMIDIFSGDNITFHMG